MKWTYEVDEGEAKVWRRDEEGLRQGHLEFRSLALTGHWLEDELAAVARNVDAEAAAMYRVARDELLDRGLIR